MIRPGSFAALTAAVAMALGPALAAAQETPMATAPEAAPPSTPAAAPAPVVAPANAPVDAIGDLIERQGGAEIDEETAETLAPGAAAAPAHTPTVIAPPTAGYVPAYARPNPGGLDRPVMLHETGVRPDGPPDLSELTYESRVRGGIAAAQGLQGPLDGAWTLNGPDGSKLYAFQMVDPGVGSANLEGAWRDLRRGEGIGGVGLIDEVQRLGGDLTLRFYPRGAPEPVLVTLTPAASGGWSGRLNEKGAPVAVTLVRDGPAPTAGYAVLGVSAGAANAPRPYDSTVRAAPVRKPVAKGKKKKPTAKKSSSSKKKPAPKLRKGKA